MSAPLVVIIMGSKSDKAHCENIAAAVRSFGIEVVLRVGSAHKTPGHVSAMLAAYEADGRPKVYITVAGRSNALSGFVDGSVSAPVIACPPDSQAFGGADLYSSIRMPSGIAPALVLDSANAALLAAKILGLGDPAIKRSVADYMEGNARRILEDDKVHDECGVIAVSNAREDASRAAFYGLFALQHRGQESAGIASSDLKRVSIHKDLGLVAHVFTEKDMAGLTGPLAIGHTRYSTTGSSLARNAQPFYIETMHGPLALGHNGNLVNAAALRRRLLERGVGLTSASDTEVMIMMLAAADGATWPERIASCMREWVGAFSFVVLTKDSVYAARDPWGLRPLSCAVLPGCGSAAASESCALRTIGSTEIRDIRPGEIVELSSDGPLSRGGIEPAAIQASCVFEYIYFARPDSVWNGIAVHEARRSFGAQIAADAPVEADLVIPVPDSSISAAIGYSHASGIPYGEGFVKNRYIGRTFIQPTESLRKQGVALKFMVMPEAIRGKRLVVVDDSIVRGTTTGPIIRLLREAGALEVHLRITSPPIRHPCHMGVDMGTRGQLIAHRLSVAQIREAVGADSLEYLSIDGMMRALGRTEGFCTACFSGKYPFDMEGAAGKEGFEP